MTHTRKSSCPHHKTAKVQFCVRARHTTHIIDTDLAETLVVLQDIRDAVLSVQDTLYSNNTYLTELLATLQDLKGAVLHM